MKRAIFTILLIFSAIIVFAQDCYNYTRSLGISYYDKGQYSVAKSQFSAAKSCPDKPGDNDLDAWIKKCDDAIAEANRREIEKRATNESKGYMNIREIKFGTRGAGESTSNFYTTLNAADIKYLVPRIYYDGLESKERNIKLFVKIIKPNGTLERGQSSPDGYTYSSDVTVSPGKNNYYTLTGWGTAAGGSYEPGVHRIELWYEGKMIYKQNFTLTETNDLIINDVQFSTSGNTGTFYNTADAADVKYLYPRITYDGLVSVSKKITLFVKIINPDGTLHTGSSSPDGYSYSDEITVSSGRNNYCTLTGWGSDSGGSYDPGTYKIEIWNGGKMLFQKNFTLSGKKILDIEGVLFGTQGENEAASNFYSSLCASDIKYLIPRITYKGLEYGSKTIRLYVKIFKPDGTLMTGASSPSGYTYSSKVKVTYTYGTENFCSVPGWGNKDGGSYSPGTYRIEFWYGGSMLYKQNFQLTDLFTVNNIDFASAKDGGKANNFGATLDASKVKYLVPRLCYNGMVNKSQKIKLFIKIFNPDGTLSHNSSSPNGYTYSIEKIIYGGKNRYCTLGGWGSDINGSYSSGTYRIEIWRDSRMIYKQNFELKGQQKKETAKISSTSSNNVNGVDLGLSVRWASCNIGASSPSDYGNYYAWGEIKPKSENSDSKRVTHDKTTGSIAGNQQFDVARANWGGAWRLPTKAEIEELISKCKWRWTTQGGHKGYKVIGPNGNSIFLPAAGWRIGTSHNHEGESGGYWSATPSDNEFNRAFNLCFSSDQFYKGWGNCDNGFSVRPVTD